MYCDYRISQDEHQFCTRKVAPVVGLTGRLSTRLPNTSQACSIGAISGDSDGQCIQLTFCACKKFIETLAVCGRALSPPLSPRAPRTRTSTAQQPHKRRGNQWPAKTGPQHTHTHTTHAKPNTVYIIVNRYTQHTIYSGSPDIGGNYSTRRRSCGE